MKLIDLLNKIANEEEVPKMITYKGEKYHITDNNYTYWKVGGLERDTLNIDTYDLNCDIKTINDKIYDEHDVAIEKWSDMVIYELTDDNYSYDLDDIKSYLATVMKTQNEIIDRLKELDTD